MNLLDFGRLLTGAAREKSPLLNRATNEIAGSFENALADHLKS